MTGVKTRFNQVSAVVGNARGAGLESISGVTLYRVKNGEIDAGVSFRSSARNSFVLRTVAHPERQRGILRVSPWPAMRVAHQIPLDARDAQITTGRRNTPSCKALSPPRPDVPGLEGGLPPAVFTRWMCVTRLEDTGPFGWIRRQATARGWRWRSACSARRPCRPPCCRCCSPRWGPRSGCRQRRCHRRQLTASLTARRSSTPCRSNGRSARPRRRRERRACSRPAPPVSGRQLAPGLVAGRPTCWSTRRTSPPSVPTRRRTERAASGQTDRRLVGTADRQDGTVATMSATGGPTQCSRVHIRILVSGARAAVISL